MRAATSALQVVRSLRRHGRQNGQFRPFSGGRGADSSTSSWGVGEPPVDEKHTERGVSRDQTFEVKEGSPSSGTSETSPRESPRAGAPKKSRTGSDMSDDGQVHTPNLAKMRSTRDMLHDMGKETEERLSSTGSRKT